MIILWLYNQYILFHFHSSKQVTRQTYHRFGGLRRCHPCSRHHGHTATWNWCSDCCDTRTDPQCSCWVQAHTSCPRCQSLCLSGPGTNTPHRPLVPSGRCLYSPRCCWRTDPRLVNTVWTVIWLHGGYNDTLWGVNYLTARCLQRYSLQCQLSYCTVFTKILSAVSIILQHGVYKDTL